MRLSELKKRQVESHSLQLAEIITYEFCDCEIFSENNTFYGIGVILFDRCDRS